MQGSLLRKKKKAHSLRVLHPIIVSGLALALLCLFICVIM